MRFVNLLVLILAMFVFTGLNYLISVKAPNNAIAEAARSKNKEELKYPVHQDQAMYAEALSKIPTCTKVTDKEDNDFYTCPDKTTITQIHWTRGSDRKGVVTRTFDSTGKNILVYGHPDDVY